MLAWLAFSACSGSCLDLPETCTPQYEPGFDAVYANTVRTSCALSGCHGNGAASGGLAMGSTASEAWTALGGYVDPGSPACSLLLDHLEPAGIGDMPPGEPLSEEERCAIREWIVAGAPPPTEEAR